MTVHEAKSIFRQRLQGLYDANEVDAMMRVVMEEVMHYSPVDVALREKSCAAWSATSRCSTFSAWRGSTATVSR